MTSDLRYFAAVVRSPAAVRNAFQGKLSLNCWWKCVLALHGAPAETVLSLEQRCECIARGFQFYGFLYRGLSLLFGGSACLCMSFRIFDFFWIAWMLTGAVYLWIAGGLAFSGAAAFRNSSGKDVLHLVAFLFFIMFFLVATAVSCTIHARSAELLPDLVNYIGTIAFVAFGAGSYMIELAALVTRESEVEAENETPRQSDG